jgi:hypothetical protein
VPAGGGRPGSFSGLDPAALIPDGSGGSWLAASTGSVTQVSWAVHRSAAGTWTRIGTGQTRELTALARVPGTTSAWGVGRVSTAAGSDAAIFAVGRIG